MNSTEILGLFRLTISDVEEPVLWSDEEAFQYLDDAQKTFCRLTGGLGDGSSTITQLAYDDTTDWVTLSPLILKIRDATDNVTGRQVAVKNFEDFRASGTAFSTTRTGRVCAIVTGIEAGRVRLYPYPSEAGQVNLVVDRLPLKTISDAGYQRMEIAEQHHQKLVTWMMHRAYGKQDAETMNNKKSADLKFEFEAYCFEAKAEKERAMHKTRVVNYGGI